MTADGYPHFWANALAVLGTLFTLAALLDPLRALGPTYRAHGELMQVALRDRRRRVVADQPTPRLGIAS